MSADEPRFTVARLLRDSRSHAGLRAALEGFPAELAGERPVGFTHSPWEVLEHLRLAAEDLVSYCLDEDYRSLGWPEGYWPRKGSAAPSAEAWRQSAEELLAATERLAELVEDETVDLYALVPTAEKPGHHLLRSALILLDHNGYHAAELIALRRALGLWK